MENNKNHIDKSHGIKERTLCIKHLEVLNDDNLLYVDLEIAILIVLTYKNDFINSIKDSLKKSNPYLYSKAFVGRKDHKEFIKEYKNIVDLIKFNFQSSQS